MQTLVINGCFRRVEIFDLIVAQGSATKGDDTSFAVANGNHKTIAEQIIMPTRFLPPSHQTSLFQSSGRNLGLFGKETQEPVPTIWGIAELELLDCFRRKSTIFKILTGESAFHRVAQKAQIILTGLLVKHQNLRAAIVLFAIFHRFSQLDAIFARQFAHRIDKFKTFGLLHKGKNIAAFAAAETFKNAFLSIYMK
ncbi:MAG: hypothetical protein BWY75_03559 [bacterium ADurb.Bin425]|nr:MAG: hypothetical protein BWY75_03559 [bacterium ADurb.Bin425]